MCRKKYKKFFAYHLYHITNPRYICHPRRNLIIIVIIILMMVKRRFFVGRGSGFYHHLIFYFSRKNAVGAVYVYTYIFVFYYFSVLRLSEANQTETTGRPIRSFGNDSSLRSLIYIFLSLCTYTHTRAHITKTNGQKALTPLSPLPLFVCFFSLCLSLSLYLSWCGVKV